jgi:hypothetical protein
MREINFNTPASITWQHPPYGSTAIEEHCEDFNLGEAVRFVMETLQPEHRLHAKIGAGGREFRFDAIDALYGAPDFPRG